MPLISSSASTYRQRRRRTCQGVEPERFVLRRRCRFACWLEQTQANYHCPHPPLHFTYLFPSYSSKFDSFLFIPVCSLIFPAQL
jgi:hypothetical protein